MTLTKIPSYRFTHQNWGKFIDSYGPYDDSQDVDIWVKKGWKLLGYSDCIDERFNFSKDEEDNWIALMFEDKKFEEYWWHYPLCYNEMEELTIRE